MAGNSPAPGTPQTGTKAYVATGLAFMVLFVGQWIADTDPVTAKEVAAWIVYGLIGSGLTGGATYITKNKPA